MKYLAPFLIIPLLLIFGFQPLQAQGALSGFESLFESATSSIGGGGGTTSNPDGSQLPDRDGGGNIDMINANWPVIGKMINKKTTLTWDKGQQPKSITLKQGSVVIFKSPVSGSSIDIDFSKFDLDPLKSYNLQLSNDAISSKRTSLKFVAETELNEAMMQLENELAYKEANGTKKQLMKAFFLEKKEFNYEADKAYHISTADPTDMKIILKFYNEFKSRT